VGDELHRHSQLSGRLGHELADDASGLIWRTNQMKHPQQPPDNPEPLPSCQLDLNPAMTAGGWPLS
jgi:hypothetical protein